MKKLKKQVEFTKLLDLEKVDIASLSFEAMMNINGGLEITKPTNEAGCTPPDVTVGCTYTCYCANTRICSYGGCL